MTESVPPKLYGGTERVVSHLVEELVRQGQDVTLFASGDSETSAHFIPGWPRALRLGGCADPIVPHVLMLEDVLRRAGDFDIVHFHTAPLHFSAARNCLRAHVTTLHGRLDLPELQPLFKEFRDVPCVSISDAQRRPLPQANWVGTVHHGLPPNQLPFHPGPGSYLAFLGRISREKRADRAIAIARACGEPLRIAAKVDPVDTEYFQREIRHLLDHPLVEYVGEIGDREKPDFLGSARALLFPIDWPEPFGLVMIEALACGTPVIAFRGGSVDEIIEPGVTGFIVDSVEEAAEAVRRIEMIDRRMCRAVFEERFTVQRMAQQYAELYRRLLAPDPVESLAESRCSTSYA